MVLNYMTYNGSMLLIKQLETFIENRIVGIKKVEQKSYFGHTKIEYIWDINDGLKPLSSK